jgi:glyoxalase family protein
LKRNASDSNIKPYSHEPDWHPSHYCDRLGPGSERRILHARARAAVREKDGHALCGFHGATLSLEAQERTGVVLTKFMGARLENSERNRFRYILGEGPRRARIDLLCLPTGRWGTGGSGIVHHIAWRTPDDESQLAARSELVSAGFNVSPVMDRNYFHSIYYREPGGVLFEIATDPPGFLIDESPETLGSKLMLPAWLENHRRVLETTLPPLESKIY